jgi:3-keto-5-aminohexanoate cleavage enzyme
MASTSGVAGKSDENRADPLKTDPEMASLTTGSLNFAGRKPSSVYVNTWETITFLAKKMFEANIRPEMEAFDVGFIQQGVKLIEQGLVRQPPHFQLVMGVDGGVPASPDNLLHMCRQLPPGASFCVAGIGRWQLNMTTMAVVLGGHVRVGLEDNIYFARGKLAPNENFVARTRRIAETLQREIATPSDARKILHLQARQRSLLQRQRRKRACNNRQK